MLAQMVIPHYEQAAGMYEGTMYKYGGTTSETGFDCSGFTQYVFKQMDVSLPRTAEERCQVATLV